jgi:hypothetical protein
MEARKVTCGRHLRRFSQDERQEAIEALAAIAEEERRDMLLEAARNMSTDELAQRLG